ncbi:MAG: hypothetical protein A2499_01370 [Stygiobacter sp. RIFOXYC12_FULL_38_8]|nr:MAG: hypothetical protein A2X62_09475 [Stygiobacter sp. GWC2_38_9]OGV08742.1 MAG: hypothetical protein A2299_01245 [Stygiobacter sp. RIFOXYB2_FULL_37_11]OGV10173.1 MAG: hypothetical protein A2237_10590 [Stygiobacter sp. RIFOXYA2_FULL_38_8]OGV13882.1 MAG: hypothetical protein A2440_12060 [Stygiobacter sp. RIFOXYC2_FULL_38_25]OGV26361.1 MAG: hypothetical protein A2499_01370 [Stygiobacter sp. RIFOXYC12_FULL_38_8]OGV80266.1 MAG: hypothetical protein A2X65_04010 [Stygiobacter sp. GWF2_38_21]
MKNEIRFFVLLTLTLLAVISCDLQKENPTDETKTSSADAAVINGIVSEEATGGALSGVNVSLNGVTKQTDANGNFNYGAEINVGSYQLTANKAGYIGITRTIVIKKDVSTFISLKLFKKEAPVTINAATGGTVGLNTNRVLQIPANALSQNTDISITQVLGSGIPVQMNDRFIIEALSLEPNGLNFTSQATLQVPVGISGINPSIIKAVSITSSGNEELSGVTSSGNSVTVPLNHFSYVYFYVPLQNIRYRTVAYNDSLKPTSAIADCRSDKAVYEVTLGAKIVSTTLPANILTAQIGQDLSSTMKRTLVVTRIAGGQKKQLYYQISGTRYIFEILNGSTWNEAAVVELQENVKVVGKDVGECHDQGGGN